MSAHLNGHEGGAVATRESVTVAASRLLAPLSESQHRVWRLSRTAAGAVLFERVSLRISGPLDHRALTAAFAAVVARHSILRTVMVIAGGKPVQCIRPWSSPPLLVDLQAADADRAERLIRLLTRLSRQPMFDLRRGPWLRLILFRQAPREHVLFLTVHHMAFDGESRAILVAELAAYLRQPSAAVRPLPPLTAQYADVARAEQARDVVADRARRVAIVAARLRQADQPATLPLDRPRSAQPTGRGAVLPWTVPHSGVGAVQSLLARARVSPFMLVVASLAIVLHEVDGQRQITLAIPVGLRRSRAEEALIGPFVNISIVSIPLSPSSRVGDVVAATRDAMLAAFAERDLPFDALLHVLWPHRVLASYGPADGDPLFRVCVAFSDTLADADGRDAPPAGVQIAPFEPVDATIGCDLFLSVGLRHGALDGAVLYNAELFESATIRRFIHRLGCRFATLASAWDTPISRLARV